MSEQIPVVILAGGEGARMGGDKPLRLWKGVRLINRALFIARGYSETVAVNVRTPDQFDLSGLTLIYDAPDIAGPLAGLDAALRFAQQRSASRVLTMPCDSPLLPPDLLSRLSAAMEKGALAALARSHGWTHPVCGLWRADLGERLHAYHAGGRSSPYGFAEEVGAAIVDWGEPRPDPFANINTPEDLARLQET
jgi:molybdopterin-guanine dinucleotide biosynthesis protein A